MQDKDRKNDIKYGRYWLNIIAVMITGILLFSSGVPVSAWVPYQSFHYIYKEGELHKVTCPAPFTVSEILSMNDLGFPKSMPNDIFIRDDGTLFIVDTANSAVIITGKDRKVIHTITEFTLNGVKTALKQPEGVFVAENGDIYVADTENNRIIQFNSTYQAIRSIIPEKNETLGEKYVFYPSKVAVDSTGRIFTVARGQFNGIMQFTSQGKFSAFVGSNLVTVSAFDILVKKFMTQQQKEKMIQFIPLEYSNLHMDDDDFIYAVTQATDETIKVKRLNPGGTDVLVRDEFYNKITQNSQIVDICTDEYENHYYVDRADGCIYSFNADGCLQYAFGGTGEQAGVFKNPASIAYHDGKIYVSDSVMGTITVFEMTTYARNIQNAVNLYRQGKYEADREVFLELLKEDANFELAYIYLGRIEYRLERYETALNYFKKGNFRGDDVVGGYGAALGEYRAEILRKNLPLIFSVAFLLTMALLAQWIWRKRRQPVKNKGNKKI